MNLARTTILMLALAGCPAPEAEPPPPPGAIDTTGMTEIGTVHGLPMTEEMVSVITAKIPPEQLSAMRQNGQFDELFRRIATGQALYVKGLEEGIADDPDVQLQIAMSARDIIASALVDKHAEAAVSDEAVQQYYTERAVQYQRPSVNARHILVGDEATARGLLAELENGADFGTLAKANSRDPATAPKGGELGWFEEGRMLKPFSDAAFGAEVGSFVGPVETRAGWHVIQVTERRESTPLEEVREQIELTLKSDAAKKFIEEANQNLEIEQKGGPGAELQVPGGAPNPPPAGNPEPGPEAGPGEP